MIACLEENHYDVESRIYNIPEPHILRKGGDMPITYRIDPIRNLVLLTCSGVVEDNEFPEFRERLLNDPQFNPGMKELADLRDVEWDEITKDRLLNFIEMEKFYISKLGECRIAVVTSSDLHFGFMRMFISMMSEFLGDFRIFRDMEEAEAWLFDEGESE